MDFVCRFDEEPKAIIISPWVHHLQLTDGNFRMTNPNDIDDAVDIPNASRHSGYKMNLLRSVFFASGATRSFTYLASTWNALPDFSLAVKLTSSSSFSITV